MAATLHELTAGGASTVLAISGGRSPWPMFRLLIASENVNWELVHIAQVDERIAPDGDDNRNWTTAASVFAGVVPECNLHPMPVNERCEEDAAAEYGATLASLTAGRGIGLTQLGLGADGHTASLFPGDPVLHVEDRDVAVTGGAHMGYRRMTLTLRAINRSRHILWHVEGASKAAPLAKLLQGDVAIPAGCVRRSGAEIIADVAAMGSP